MPVDPKLIGAVQFIAFLLNHIDEIQPKLVVFQFVKSDADYVDHIARALRGRQMKFFQIPTKFNQRMTIEDFSLLLTIGDVSRINTLFTSDVREFRLDFRVGDGNKSALQPSFAMKISDSRHYIVDWSLEKHSDRGIIEEEYLQYFEWTVFLGQANRIPSGKVLACIDNCLTDRAGNKWSINGTLVVHGFHVGIYKILAERMNSPSMEYVVFNYLGENNTCKLNGVLKEARLTSENKISNGTVDHWISLCPQMTLNKNLLGSLFPVRYLVVVPRIVIESNRFLDYFNPVKVVAGLLLSTSIFVGIRYCCRLVDTTLVNKNSSLVSSFIDTFGRSLGIGTGAWLGRSTAERQLLTVISIFAILSGSIFSGVLYEQQLFMHEQKFRLNSLDDICLASMKLHIPMDLIPTRLFNGRMYNLGTFYLK